MSGPSFVYLVDDDISFLRALERFLRSKGYDCLAFASAEEFLAAHDPNQPGCAVIDLTMPGIDGMQLQNLLKRVGRPLLFVSGNGDLPIGVLAMKQGAVDFLTKPINENALLSAVDEALQRDLAARTDRQKHNHAVLKITSLTLRERQVFDLVVAGRLNKQIAHDLEISEKTVKLHRGRMMTKLGVRSVTDLVRLQEMLTP
ncbi:response regulator transcription factor [Rhizobium wenxiniae]|uniref:response regulator transcription factor n=1 Tax=Rhizobium wenxiniae TaxID=1737357 RepID=UPI001C6EBF87|nr:response regulator [Rhizobium wenxiniae]MBW9091922.1 response regulator transcription factor [Rhizobium wenxiniae]